ncbi:Ion channel [Ekhidna lutea]|uniref:Ion channel n=1 Tax=Ekhidna lutea TaxID=447679 RepID=A0A239F2K9_EKHLU|nr:potassium channel family protein [Ekhidna lutea]SNS51240.1 Ion channel [Ekhidna lutea]
MRITALLALLSLGLVCHAQDEEYRVIPSLTDWIEEINHWPDSIYQVENIKVIIDGEKDSLIAENYFISHDTVEEIAATVHKPVEINGLIIDNDFGRHNGSYLTGNYRLKNIRFKKRFRIQDYQSLVLHTYHLVFEQEFIISYQQNPSYFNFISCHFKSWVAFFDIQDELFVNIQDSKINEHIQFTRTPSLPSLIVENSDIYRADLGWSKFSQLHIRDSRLSEISLQSSLFDASVHLVRNQIDSIEVSGAQFPANNTYIPFDQVSEKLFVLPISMTNPNRAKYFATDNMDFALSEEYDNLIASYKLLLSGYQNRGDRQSYGACFVEMKNLETRHLAYQYENNPSFKGFFTWKINQFLKIFSAYGTEPARAIIFSFYVIIFFALIYLFFPNSWDAHGRTRIMNRYRFFLKYLNRNEGASEVYQEEKEKELMPFHEFRDYLEQQGKTAPKFFYVTALPLYKWSVSGSRLSGWFLSRIDVLNGKWSEVPENGKFFKSTLVIGAFIMALIYDIFIKVLNAIMLSINTFTTLGFGEIPIKGLPRYLAIIQGFIGWFMLTIFSVSLISQLLN